MIPEMCMPDASYKNLKQLVSSGLVVTELRVVVGGHILIVFDTGAYLATGLGVGVKGETCLTLAKFMGLLSGDARQWYTYLSKWFVAGGEGAGAIIPLVIPKGYDDPELKIFNG